MQVISPSSVRDWSASFPTPGLSRMMVFADGEDFAGEGRTLERLGLDGMEGPQIRRVMNEGFG